MKLLLDEMYSASLAEGLRAVGVDAITVHELGLAGSSDADVFSSACAAGYTVLTENVSDFAGISAEHLTAGKHYPGALIALSNRFSRRPAGREPLIAAIATHASDALDDRVVYLEAARNQP